MEPAEPLAVQTVPLLPFAPDPAVRGIDVTLHRPAPGVLVLRYRLTGDLERLAIPPPAPGRADGLWRHTCFEAFVADRGTGYREYNFAPSQAWAAYAFDGYRSGMRPLDGPAPGIEVRREEGALLLGARLVLPGVPELPEPSEPPGPQAPPLRLGLAAVIEHRDGTLGYWALRHAGRPDFHHPDGFALALP